MLQARASEISPGDDVPAGLGGRVARRRTMKMVVGATASVIVVGAIAAGAVTTATTKGKHPRVIASNTTTIAPPTPTTVVPSTTIPTSVPVAVPPVVAGVGCPTSSVTAPFDVRAPSVGTREVSGLTSAIVSRVRSFVGPRAGFATDAAALEPDVVLGPKGWSCRVFRSNGGGAVMYVYPPAAQGSFVGDAAWATSATYAGPEVRVETAVLGHDPDISLACPVFATDPIVEHWAATAAAPTTCALPTGRTVTKFGAGVFTFVDADGTRGVGVMRVRTTAPLDGDFGVVTCKLTGADATLCDAVISDYITRYPGSAPAGQTAQLGGVVTVNGVVGTLQFAKSTEADVRSVVGAPSETARASFSAAGPTAGSLLPDYQALGYDCTTAATPARTPLFVQPAARGPYCATIYYINVATKTLAAFRSSSPKYSTVNGTKVGMTPADAQRREGKQLLPHGCLGSFVQQGALYQNGLPMTTAAYLVVFVGPSASDLVSSVESESNTNPVGMLFC